MPLSKLESVKPCAVCESPEAVSLLYRTGAFDVLLCRRCRLAYINVEFTVAKGEGIPDLFRDTYQRNERDLLARFDRDLASIERFARPPGRLLDVGCGGGWFLSAASRQGWAAEGVDLDLAVLTVARQEGHRVEWATYDEVEYAPATFDVVTMFNVIEHMPNPIAALRKTREILRPGGLLVVETPTNDFLPVRLVDLVYKASQGRITAPVRYVYNDSGWGHAYRYARRTLEMALIRSGFDLLELRPADNPTLRLHLHERNYGRPAWSRAVNALGLGMVFLVLNLGGLKSRMIAYGRPIA